MRNGSQEQGVKPDSLVEYLVERYITAYVLLDLKSSFVLETKLRNDKNWLSNSNSLGKIDSHFIFSKSNCYITKFEHMNVNLMTSY